MADLSGTVALVTGASRGMGAAIARRLARDGADIALTYSASPEKAEGVGREIEALGRRALVLQADSADPAAASGAVDRTAAEFGRLDILVANAGVQRDVHFVDMTLADWSTVIAINLTGQFLCCREAVRAMSRQGVTEGVSKAAGKIICMSSVHEVIPWGGHVNYASSKGGIQMMMKSLAQEVAPHRIRVNSIAPGAIRTPINKAAWDSPEALKTLLELVPYGRIGESEDIGRAAVWLASDDSDYVVGTTLFVDGGMTLYPGFADNG